MESNTPESLGVGVRGSGVDEPHPGPSIGRYARDKGHGGPVTPLVVA
jgi:hypothetical protein